MKETKHSNAKYVTKAFLKMTRHTASIHEGRKPFKCEVCEKSFAEKSKLGSHMLSVHDRKKPFNCKECDKTFSKKDNMTRPK